MTRFVARALALIVAGWTTSAAAADLNYGSPYTVYQPLNAYSWAGPYLGGNVGYGWGSVENNPTQPSGFVGGVQAGYNFQNGSPWVFGIEADIQGTTADDRFAPWKFSNPWFGTVRGRAGYAVNNVLLYAKGGAALTDNRYRTFFTPTGVLAGSASDTRWGGTIGAGIEVGFAPNWTAGVEYDHLFMQDKTYNLTTPTGALFSSIRDRQDVDLVTVRVNYKWGGPVVARY